MSVLRQPSNLGPESAARFRFRIVVARTNPQITGPLLDGALATLSQHGAARESIEIFEVPGAFELPMTAARLAKASTAAIICIGALVRGETPHFDHLAAAVAAGIERVAIETGVPVVFGVLTCDSPEQGAARAGGAKGNKGAEAAAAAIEMAALYALLDEAG